jgi:hypothetical protein
MKAHSTIALAAFAGTALFSTAAGAATISVSNELVNRINKDATLKANVFKKLGYDAGAWKIKSIKITNGRMDAIGKNLKLPDRKQAYITSTEVLNCVAIESSRELSLGKEITNTTSVTKSETFGSETSASVSGSYMGIEASASQTFTYDSSKSTTEEKSTTTSISDTTTVSFPAQVGGFVSVLYAMKLSANKIPYSIDFTPVDTTQLEFTLEGVAGQACIYQHKDYGGKKACYNIGTNKSWIGDDWNDMVSSVKLSGTAAIALWEHKGYGGYKDTYTSSSGWIGKKHNDEYSSFKVYGKTGTKNIAWSSLKNVMPADARKFTLRGTVTIDDTSPDGKRLVNYAMSTDSVTSACNSVTGGEFSKGGTAMAAKNAGPKVAAAPAKAGAPKPGVVQREVSQKRFEELLKSRKLVEVKK